MQQGLLEGQMSAAIDTSKFIEGSTLIADKTDQAERTKNDAFFSLKQSYSILWKKAANNLEAEQMPQRSAQEEELRIRVDSLVVHFAVPSAFDNVGLFFPIFIEQTAGG